MKRSKSLILLLMLALIGSAPVPAQQDDSDMLEVALRGVVIVTLDDLRTLEVEGKEMPLAALGIAGSPSGPYVSSFDFSESYSYGSGFLVERNGRTWILTNAHVVNMAQDPRQIGIMSITGKKYSSSLRALDSYYDVAVLELTDPPGEEFLILDFAGENAIRIGRNVYSIGSPGVEEMAFQFTVTEGIISGLNRSLTYATGRQDHIQHTAVVTHGNSGGPLVTTGGKVIGMNTRGGGLPQFNFALAVTTLKRVFENLVDIGHVRRSYYGIHFTTRYKQRSLIDQMFNGGSALREMNSRPVLSAVLPGSPGEQELTRLIGSSLIAVNGMEVHTLYELMTFLEQIMPGDTVTFSLEGPSGDREDIAFRTRELDDVGLTAIAQETLQRYAGIQVENGDGCVVVERGNTIRRRNIKNSEGEPTRIPTGLEIIAAGFCMVEDSEQHRMYPILSVADLGKAIRLIGLEANLSIIGVDSASTMLYELFFIQGDEDVIERSVIY